MENKIYITLMMRHLGIFLLIVYPFRVLQVVYVKGGTSLSETSVRNYFLLRYRYLTRVGVNWDEGQLRGAYPETGFLTVRYPTRLERIYEGRRGRGEPFTYVTLIRLLVSPKK